MPGHSEAAAYFESPEGRSLGYCKTDGAGPGVVFLGGFRSDMTGTKALHLEAWAQAAGRAFLRFDYSGHGVSSGAFEDGAIGDWFQDARAALDALTEGPQILVGSSMGGWIALLLARARPERIAGLVGIAAAPDFTEELMWARFSPAEKAALEASGRLERPSEYSEEPEVLTRRLIEDGRAHLVLRAPLTLNAPMRLLQGVKDADVPAETAMRILSHVDCPDARAILIKDGDHRLSEPRELALLTETLDAML